MRPPIQRDSKTTITVGQFEELITMHSVTIFVYYNRNDITTASLTPLPINMINYS